MSDHLMCCRIVSCLMIMWLISDSGAASCPEPPPVDNSIFIAKEAEGQLWGTYLCTKGYHLVGPDSFWCNDSKEWDASTPECRLGHCPGPVLANGESNSSGPVNVREKVTFKCDDHYILKGSNWSECLGDHTWEPPLPICKRDCDPPGYPEHGYFDGGAFTSGSVVTYFCKERYHLVGQRELRCLDGEWSGQVPACERNPEAPTPAGQIAFEKALHAFQERKDLCSATKSFLKRLEESGLTVDELKSSLEMKKAELKAKIVQHHS